MKCDLRDTAFLLVARFDTVTRLENALLVSKYLCNHFDTNVILCEFDTHCNGIFKRLRPQNVTYEFYEDFDPILHRTRHINSMVRRAKEKFVAIWDIDVIAPCSQIIDAIKCLRDGSDFVFPYEHHFCDTSDELRRFFMEHPRVEILMQYQKFMNEMYAPNPVGGAFIANRESYIQCGGENENFYGWGVEDGERQSRWLAHKKNLRRIVGPLFHLSHPRGCNSLINNSDEYVLKERLLLDEVRKIGWKES